MIRADAPTDVIRPGALTGAVPRRPTPGHLALAALVLVAVSGMGWRFLRPGPLPRRHIEGGVSFRADPDRLDRLLLRVGGIEADRITAWSIRDAGAPAGVAHDAGTPDESGGAPQGSSGLLVGGESGEPVSLPLGPGERRSGLVLDVTLEDGGRRRHALGRVEGSLWHLAREIRRDRVIDLIGRGHTLEGFKDISLTDHSDLFDDEEGFRAEVQTLVEADPHLRAVLAAGAAFRQYFASEVPVQDRWAMYEAYRPVVFIDLLLLSQRVPALFDFQGVTQGLVHRTYDRDVPPTGPAEISITGGPTCWWPRGYSDVINIASWNSLFPHTDGIMRPRDVPDSTPVRRPALSDYQWIRSYPGSIPAWPDGTRRVRVRAMVTYYGPAYFWTLRFKGPEGEPLDLRLLHSGEPAWYLAMNGQPEHRPTRGLSGVIDAVTTTREFGGRVWGDLTVTVPVEVLPAPPLDVTVRQDTLPGIALGDLGTMERLTYIRDLTVEPLRH